MVRFSQERILLIGDRSRQLEPVLAQAMPAAQLTRVDDYFEGIAELSAHDYSAVIASAEPIQRRPQAELGLDALVQQPGAAPAALVKAINQLIAPDFQIAYVAAGKDAPATEDGYLTLSLPVRTGQEICAHLHLRLTSGIDENVAQHFLSQAA